jgi:hypothetical protein
VHRFDEFIHGKGVRLDRQRLIHGIPSELGNTGMLVRKVRYDTHLFSQRVEYRRIFLGNIISNKCFICAIGDTGYN